MDDNKILKLIRDGKRKPFDPIDIGIKLDKDNVALSADSWSDIARLDLGHVHFSINKDVMMAQAMAYVQLKKFYNLLGRKLVQYNNELSNVYGDYAPRLVDKLSKAYMADPVDMFKIDKIIAELDTLFACITSREDREESIFDGKRIEEELVRMAEVKYGDD